MMSASTGYTAEASSTSEEAVAGQDDHVVSSNQTPDNEAKSSSVDDDVGNCAESTSKVGGGGQSNTALRVQEENVSGLVSTAQSDGQEKMQTARYSSPVSQSFTEVSTMSYSKDIRDPNAVHGSCGLYNLGNTCFMNAGLQCLMSSAPLVKFFLTNFVPDETNKHTLLGQYFKLLCKMWCGQFSVVHPKEFKDTLGLYHSQFQDYRQHDCQEFLALLLDTFHEQINTAQNKVTSVSNNIANPGTSPLHALEPLSNSLNNQDSSPVAESADLDQSEMSVEADPVSSTVSQSKPSVLLSSQLEPNETAGPKITSECSSSTSVNNSTIFTSEDSNQSTVSIHSTDSEPSLNIRKLQLQSNMDSGKSDDDVTMATVSSSTDLMTDDKNNRRVSVSQNTCNTNTSVLNRTANSPHVDAKTDHNLITSKSDNLAQLNNVCSSKLPPGLLDYYGKETKTLNTNMLVNENTDSEMSSEKFAKQDNRYRPAEEEVNILQEVLGEEAKADKDIDPVNFGIKDTNLRVEKKSRFLSKSCPNVLDSDNAQDVYELNNIKRIKIDSAEPNKSVQEHEAEKNVQMQEMSKFNTQKVLQEEISDGDSSVESMDAEEIESSEEEGEVTSRSSSMNALSLDANFVNNRADIYQKEADAMWNKYLRENNSVVVSTFQGQFQSTVVCSVCSNVSVTYEPFMYLSLPIPRAMERQICVIYVSRSMPPTRYLLNMHKNDKVHQLKKELLRLIDQLHCDIIVAEVLNSHVSRVLDDNVMLRYVNDTSRKIYAFEMIQPMIPVEEPPEENLDLVGTTVISTAPRSLSETATSSDTMPDSADIFSNMGTFGNAGTMFQMGIPRKDPMVSGDVEMGDGFPEAKDWSDTKMEKESRHLTSPEPSYVDPDMEGKGNPDLAGTGLWEWSHAGFSDCDATWDNVGSTSSFNPPPLPRDVVNSITGIADQWRTCAICLEELSDNDLLTHQSCSGTFCQGCLDMSLKHSTEAGYCCPICLMPANMMEDFSPLVSASSQKPKLRVIAIPVAFRCDVMKEENISSEKLFGHPAMLYVPNRLPGESLYEMIDAIMQVPAMYSVVLTDGQGLRCSRCMYTAHCTGCVLCRDGVVTLQPGDNLTVHMMDTSHGREEQAEVCQDHASMEDLRPNEPITVYDCFRAFTESEVLDEHNPWYCSQCQQNQCAKKTMTVWRYPDSLILHLKRFVFHELSSTKVDNQVVFPHKDLDLQQFLSGPKVKDLNYDLYSIVCHFGGSHSGHYTSYTSHPLTSEWHYNNDETVTKQDPRDDDYSSAYVLFYQRKGTACKFQPPSGLHMVPEDEPPSHSEPSPPRAEQAVVYTCALPPWMETGYTEESAIGSSEASPSPMSVTQMSTEQAEPDSTFDFYS